MNSEDLAKLLAGALGIILSLAFSIVPGLSDWYYGEVGKKYRGLVMAGVGALVSALLYVFSCVYPVEIPGVVVSCGQSGIVTLLTAWVLFMVTNQTTYLATPDSPAKDRVRAKG